MSNFKENIYQGKSFIYQVADHYYVIGADTFAELTNAEETDILELFQNAVKKNNERQMSKYLEKMVRITSNYRVESKEHLRTQEKLFTFLDELEQNDEDAYQSLQNQYMQFVELCDKYLVEEERPIV